MFDTLSVSGWYALIPVVALAFGLWWWKSSFTLRGVIESARSRLASFGFVEKPWRISWLVRNVFASVFVTGLMAVFILGMVFILNLVPRMEDRYPWMEFDALVFFCRAGVYLAIAATPLFLIQIWEVKFTTRTVRSMLKWLLGACLAVGTILAIASGVLPIAYKRDILAVLRVVILTGFVSFAAGCLLSPRR